MLPIMKQLALFSALAALVFAGIAAGLYASRPADHTLRVAELELNLKSAQEEIAKLKAELAKPRPAPVTKIPASGSGSATAPGRDGPDKTAAPANAGPGEPSSMAKMFQDPKMREMVKAQQGMHIEMQYAKLISQLGLDEKEASHFKSLLADRLSTKTDMGFKMMDASLTKEQRKIISDDFDAKKKASDASIRQFLNDDGDYKTFQHWEDTEPERAQLMMGRAAFDAVSAPLSGEQERQLIDLMAEVRKRPSQIPDWNNPKNIDPAQMTGEFATRMLKQYDAQQEAVRQGATAFLSTEQQSALKKMQDQLRTMTEAGIKMSQSMMGKK